MCSKKLDNEPEVVTRAINGDTEAFGLLYDAYARDIYRFIFYKTGHKESAEDLTSKTFYKALKAIRRYDKELASFGTWIYAIARNSTIDHYRSSRPGSSLEKLGELPDSRYQVESDVDTRIALGEIDNYLRGMSEREREIVQLRIWEDKTFDEITQICGGTIAANKMAFSRAIARLRKDLSNSKKTLVAITLTLFAEVCMQFISRLLG